MLFTCIRWIILLSQNRLTLLPCNRARVLSRRATAVRFGRSRMGWLAPSAAIPKRCYRGKRAGIDLSRRLVLGRGFGTVRNAVGSSLERRCDRLTGPTSGRQETHGTQRAAEPSWQGPRRFDSVQDLVGPKRTSRPKMLLGFQRGFPRTVSLGSGWIPGAEQRSGANWVGRFRRRGDGQEQSDSGHSEGGRQPATW